MLLLGMLLVGMLLALPGRSGLVGGAVLVTTVRGPDVLFSGKVAAVVL